jgi:large subunit ribosomal protein L21
MTKIAVIQTGGKQYIAEPGKSLRIEKLPGDYKEGDKVIFDQVLLTDDGNETLLGMPVITGAAAEAEITKIARAKKIDVIRYKAKSRYFKKRGHRQPFFEVKITEVR